MLRTFGLFACVLLLAGCELILVDESDKDYTMDGGGTCSTMCDDICVDLRTDASHCGECGNECSVDERCVDSECVGAVTCDPGLEACGSECVDTENSSAHCSECFRPCDGDCMDSICSGELCDSGDLVCPGVGCINPRSRLHCGDCGNECAADELCTAGGCEVDVCGGTGDVDCGDGCFDLQTSAEHCGSCDNACPGLCFDGECGTGCDTGLTECTPGRCVDLQSDFLGCGTCGNVCDPGVQCVGGDCDCPFSEACGVCASPRHQEHCGGTCGNECAGNQRCSGSACVPLPANAGCNRDGTCPIPPFRILPDPLIGGGLVGTNFHICPDTLTAEVAAVACRQHGFDSGRLVMGDSSAIRGLGGFRSVMCDGSEANLNYCTYDFPPSCSYDPVLVVCELMP